MTTEDRVMTLFERANPVPDIDDAVAPMRASRYLADLERRSSNMTLTALEPDAPEQQAPKRTWLMAAAAAVAALALIAGLIFAGTRADDEPVPADQPEPTVAAVEPEPTVASVEPEPDAEADDAAPPAEPQDQTEDATDPVAPADPVEAGDALPATFESVPAGRYTTSQLGVDATFDLPGDLLLTSNRPGNVTLIGGYDGSYVPETGVAVNLNRWAGWSTRDEATLVAPTGSIDPYDVDAWVASNDITLLSDTEREIAGRPARVFDVQVDPASTVQATTYPNGPGCFPGWEPCFHMGAIANDDGQRTDWVSAKRVTRFYLLTIEGSEPLIVAVGAQPGSDFFDQIESTLIGSLELGPDAPPIGAD